MELGDVAKIDNIFAFLAFMGVLAVGAGQLKRKGEELKKLIGEHEKGCVNIIHIKERLESIERMQDQILQTLLRERGKV